MNQGLRFQTKMDGKALSARQVRVIPYLLGATSVEQGCKRARVSKAAVYSITLTVDVYGHRLKNDKRAVDALDDRPNGSKMVAAQADSVSDDGQVLEFIGAPGGI